ncbi:MAG: class II fructose-bisphosphate aldolase [Candidatus Gracilibacteria bacterium]|nr:class II fructose-bisphosphate aldolase [Candidatus Gracilibacteria bacterium]MDQ7022334.1 class II fructose-bisphosphate aldolase [Candidatus Gracilibacteria bacterium]
MKILDIVSPGVIYGEDLKKVYAFAKENKFAIPAINVVGSNSINSALEAAKEVNSPIIIQFSSGGGKFNGSNGLDTVKAQVLGSVAGALHVHTLAEAMGVVVILHTDHANKKALPWIDGLLEENKKYFEKNNRPLFSSHMLDLSVETLEENMEISTKYFKEFNKLNIGLEVEIGITGGEEEGADSTSDKSKMYTSPEELLYAYEELSKIGDNFTIAAMFGNVHGVYKPGNVELKPEILDQAQKFIGEKVRKNKPLDYVFHGGSGSEESKIKQALDYGVIKMNVDTDTQWAFWEGTKEFSEKNKDYMQSQIGNPDGEDLPNKKYYDPRKWLSSAQNSMKNRIIKAFEDLNAVGRN